MECRDDICLMKKKVAGRKQQQQSGEEESIKQQRAASSSYGMIWYLMKNDDESLLFSSSLFVFLSSSVSLACPCFIKPWWQQLWQNFSNYSTHHTYSIHIFNTWSVMCVIFSLTLVRQCIIHYNTYVWRNNYEDIYSGELVITGGYSAKMFEAIYFKKWASVVLRLLYVKLLTFKGARIWRNPCFARQTRTCPRKVFTSNPSSSSSLSIHYLACSWIGNELNEAPGTIYPDPMFYKRPQCFNTNFECQVL